MSRDDFLFSLGRMDRMLEDMDVKLGAMCSKLEGMVTDLEREAAA